MRLDKYLKVSRVIKRRTLANEVADAGRVLVNGKPAPIIGNICMDTCMLDITGIEAKEGDPVTIFGSEPGNTVTDMANVLGTIPYEIMTSISTRVKRIYTKE